MDPPRPFKPAQLALTPMEDTINGPGHHARGRYLFLLKDR